MNGALYMAAIRALPRRRLSRAVRPLAEVRSAMAVRRFAARYGVDLTDAELPLDGYRSIHELFTRRLRPGARPLDPDPGSLLSPVDGVLSQAAAVGSGVLPQAKGRTYPLSALLADDDGPYRAGSHACLYLAPKDYHRIHAPCDAALHGLTHVPGDLYPVNEMAVAHVDGLFAKNERLIAHLVSERLGRVAVVMVGATIVGKVRATAAPDFVTNLPGVKAPRRLDFSPPLPIGRGEELGVFEMGSTVVLVTERPVVFVRPLGEAVQFGEALGRFA